MQGLYTAIVTPFHEDGRIDFESFQNLIERQIEAGVDGIVPAGTTGESPTISHAEQLDVIRVTVEVCRGRASVIAGTGSNATQEAVDMTRQAIAMGIDATLQVTPYYNKPNQEGLYRHFSAVAELGCPVVLYNVPGRSGCEIGIDTVARLAKHPAIVAIKEAGGSVDRVSAILGACELDVLSGDDTLALPMMSVGAKGLISVASNVHPEGTVRMIKAALEGRWDEAREAHAAYYRLFNAMFLDTNPIPVKTALAMMGLAGAHLRLPLCPMDATRTRTLREVLNTCGIPTPKEGRQA